MEFFTDYRIGLIMQPNESSAKYISIIRKYNPGSISDIKSAIANREYVVFCEYTSDSGIRKVRRCYDELKKAGAEVEIYENGSITTREYISNLIGTYSEIDAETQTLIDAEVEADCEEEN
jgi:hypothetical protein